MKMLNLSLIIFCLNFWLMSGCGTNGTDVGNAIDSSSQDELNTMSESLNSSAEEEVYGLLDTGTSNSNSSLITGLKGSALNLGNLFSDSAFGSSPSSPGCPENSRQVQGSEVTLTRTYNNCSPGSNGRKYTGSTVIDFTRSSNDQTDSLSVDRSGTLTRSLSISLSNSQSLTIDSNNTFSSSGTFPNISSEFSSIDISRKKKDSSGALIRNYSITGSLSFSLSGTMALESVEANGTLNIDRKIAGRTITMDLSQVQWLQGCDCPSSGTISENVVINASSKTIQRSIEFTSSCGQINVTGDDIDGTAQMTLSSCSN